MFEQLKSGLSRPLHGMGTAFSSSMFGLSGALVLGFLDLTAGQAQNRFFNELEEWLAGLTRVSGGALGDGEAAIPGKGVFGVADHAARAIVVERVVAARLAEGDLRRHAARRRGEEIARRFARGALDVVA